MNQRLDTDTLAEAIAEQLHVLEQLRELARRQSEFIRESDMTRLLSLLSTKEPLLLQLRSVDTKLEPFRHDDPDQRVWRSHADRLRCRQMAERCTALRSEFLLLEKQCESELKQKRDRAAVRLDSMHASSQAAHAYKNHLPSSSNSRLDLSSES